MDTIHEDQYTYFIISCSFLLRMRSVSEKKSCRENQNTHFVFSSVFFLENLTACEIIWKNIVERGRPQIKIWRINIACGIPKAIHTFKLCNTHCSSTVTITARSHFSVTLNVHCLSCSSSVQFFGEPTYSDVTSYADLAWRMFRNIGVTTGCNVLSAVLLWCCELVESLCYCPKDSIR